MHKVVLLRHGESTWNLENRFTGWTDVDLSERGTAEAHRAGLLLKADGYVFDMAFTSVLKRAIRTLWITLDEMNLMWIPVCHSWRLNERHYGALQGLNKAETAAKYGDAQVKLWRRGYDIPPPALTEDDRRWPGRDPRYHDLAPKDIPLAEGYGGSLSPLLARCHCSGNQVRRAGDHCSPWQQPASTGQVSGRHLQRRYRGVERSDWRAVSLRA